MDLLLTIWLSLFGQTIQTRQTVTTTYENVDQAIIRVFKKDAKAAKAIFMAESGLNPKSVGDHGNSIGVAQIYLPAHAGKIPASDKIGWLKNFQNNLALAKRIQTVSGWWPWTMFKNGEYKKYL